MPDETPAPEPEEKTEEAPAPEAPEAPEETPTPPVDTAAVKARREAKNLRDKLREAQTSTEDAVAAAVAERDERIGQLESELLDAQAQLKAVGKLRNPTDVTRFVDVTSVGLDKLDDAIAAVLKERPYLGVAAAGAGQLPQGQQNGDRPSGPDANEWLREHLQRR